MPEGSFFYLGDNPDLSDDSRVYGWGELGRVEGRVGLRAFPVSASPGLGDRPVLEEWAGVERSAGGLEGWAGVETSAGGLLAWAGSEGRVEPGP